MNIAYSKTRTLNTAEMVGVYLDPPLAVEYKRQPSMEITRKLMVWEAKDYQDDDLLTEIAAEVIVSVTNHEGERYEMASAENIAALGDATELGMDLVNILVRGWLTLVGMERIAAKKN